MSSPQIQHRDRTTHPEAPIELSHQTVRDDDTRRKTVSVRCRICGQRLSGHEDGGISLSRHLKSNPECRARINRWLEARMVDVGHTGDGEVTVDA